MNRPTLADVKRAQPHWFDPKTARFFGDTNYRVLKGSDGKFYLVRRTSQWSDMFGQPKTYRWRVNPLREDLDIAPLLDTEFRDIEDVKTFLRSR